MQQSEREPQLRNSNQFHLRDVSAQRINGKFGVSWAKRNNKYLIKICHILISPIRWEVSTTIIFSPLWPVTQIKTARKRWPLYSALPHSPQFAIAIQKDRTKQYEILTMSWQISVTNTVSTHLRSLQSLPFCCYSCEEMKSGTDLHIIRWYLKQYTFIKCYVKCSLFKHWEKLNEMNQKALHTRMKLRKYFKDCPLFVFLESS